LKIVIALFYIFYINWTESYLSKYFGTNTNKYILEGLAGICKSIKKLIFDIMYSINSGIIKLIEVSKPNFVLARITSNLFIKQL
jgi:hypothetical protein